MRKTAMYVAGVIALASVPEFAQAAQIAQIQGYYDVDAYDTPSLSIQNTSAYAFTNVSIMLTGYQGVNNGKTASESLPDIAANSNLELIWGSGCNGTGPCAGANTTTISTTSRTITGDSTLFSYDYDDSAPGTGPCPPSPINGGLCGQPGNFYVTLTATWNGKSVYSQFGPDNTITPGNAAGTYVAFLGLTPSGLAEDPTYDSHSAGGPNGVLAYIYEGTPPAVPEPSFLYAIGGVGAAMAFAARRRVLASRQ